MEIESSYFILSINLLFSKSLLGSVTCKNFPKKSQNCRVLENHAQGLKTGKVWKSNVGTVGIVGLSDYNQWQNIMRILKIMFKNPPSTL